MTEHAGRHSHKMKTYKMEMVIENKKGMYLIRVYGGDGALVDILVVEEIRCSGAAPAQRKEKKEITDTKI